MVAIGVAACGDLERPSQAPLAMSAEDLYSDQYLPLFQIALSEASMAKLAEDPYTYVEGGFRYGPFSFERVGVRLKGNASFRTLDEKPAFKVKLNYYTRGQRLFGLETFTLNNLEQDPTMLRETLAYAVFRAAGVPASRTGYAEVSLNGELLGLYLNIETVDDSFLAHNFDDPSGGLYEGDYGDDLHPSHVWRFEHDEGSNLERTDLLAFTEWVHREGDQVFYEPASLLDADEYWSFSAAEAVVGHWDGYWIAHNYRVYHEPTLDKWSFLPWGMDQTLRRRIEPFEQLSYLPRRCREHARCLPDYVRRVREVIDIFESLDLESNYERIADFIDDAARRDPRKSFSNGTMDSKRDVLVNFIQERPDELRGMLDCIHDGPDGAELDGDGDGHGACYRDCNDGDADVFPGADEICDGIDNNCSGNVDDNLSCGCPEVTIDGVRFLLCDLNMSWANAANWCFGLGAVLARIDSSDQNQAVWDATRQIRAGTWYIGLSDIGRDDGDFYWIDGGDLDFEAWAPGEPNLDGAEHCVHYRSSAAEWADIACGNRKPFVCRAVD
jgi:hypothetical protein